MPRLTDNTDNTKTFVNLFEKGNTSVKIIHSDTENIYTNIKIYDIHCLIMEYKCTLYVYEKEVMECK